MELEANVYAPVRDGTRLALDLYHPSGPGKRPAVLFRTPYLKDVVPMPGMPSWADRAAGLVDAGYTVAVNDTRGTGFSEGVYDYYNYDGGPFDGYDVIEWLAQQPWCDGNVAIAGQSALGILGINAVVQQPPSLRAAAFFTHTIDPYLEQWFVGGVFRYENRMQWAMGMLSRIAPILPMNPQDPALAMKRKVHAGRLAHVYDRVRQNLNPVDLDWLTYYYHHKTYDETWAAMSLQSAVANVDLPVLHGGVWFDHFIKGTLNSFQSVSGPKKLSVSPGMLHGVMEFMDPIYEQWERKWFDYYVRGEENGIADGPAARYFLMGEERWVEEEVLPVPHKETPLFLSARQPQGATVPGSHSLSSEPPGGSEPITLVHDPANPNRTVADPRDQRGFEAKALTFETAPLDHDVEVVGTPRLRLFASSSAADVDWCVRLCDVYPDGRSQLLNIGALKGSHFSSHAAPEALERDRVYEFDVEIWAVANVFKAGHRIRVSVSTSDFPFFEVNELPSTNLIYGDARYPSALVLPVVER